MTEAKHTPGPWWVECGGEDDGHANQWPTIVSASRVVVGTEGLYGDIDQDKIDACLIAAAPELLVALIALVDDRSQERIPNRLWVAARAAIAKATGGQ